MTILNQVKQWVKLRSLYSSIRACPHFEHDDKNEINCSQTVLGRVLILKMMIKVR